MQAGSRVIVKLTYRFACVVQLASVRMLPWAKANINPTGQALVISAGAFCNFISYYCCVMGWVVVLTSDD